MLTIITRIIRMTLGKKMTTKHEVVFWAGCVVFGTIALAVINAGMITPIKDRLANLRIASPNLHCSFISGAVGGSVNGSPPNIFYQLKIVNSGSPSVAWKWNLKIILTTGQIIALDATENPSFQTIIDPNTQQQSKFDNGQYLPNIMLENPLQSGAGKSGWVSFRVDTATEQDLERIGNRFIIQFEDCDGNETCITNIIIQKGGILQKVESDK